MEEHLAVRLNKTIHQKARLGIMSILMASEEADFNYLKDRLKLTDGNLSSHLSLLEREKYIKIKKRFVKKKPKTLCRMTEKGRHAFQKYLENLEKIIRQTP
jgi:DNA-binding MarR family transcriptional regulator